MFRFPGDGRNDRGRRGEAARVPRSGSALRKEQVHEAIAADDFSKLRRSVNKLQKVFPEERFLDIELDASNQCNLLCRMCYHSLQRIRDRPPAYFPPDLLKILVEGAGRHMKKLTLSLGSEPLTSPEFVRLLEIAGGYRIPELTFTTNATLMDETISRAAIANGVTEIVVSLDGATPGTFEKIRRGARMDVVLENIARLTRLKKEAGSSLPRLRVDVVLMKSNISEAADIVDLAARLGAEKIHFAHLVAYQGLDIEAESLWHFQGLSNYHLRRAIERAREASLRVAGRPMPFGRTRSGTGRFLKREKWEELIYHPRRFWRKRVSFNSGYPRYVGEAFRDKVFCFYPFFHIALNAEGRVLACPFSHGVPAFGRISKQESIDRIWLNPKFMDLRARILNKNPLAMCKRCPSLSRKNPDAGSFFRSRRP